MIIHPNFDPVAISIGPLDIHWYGVMYLIAFIGGAWIGIYRGKKTDDGWNNERVWDLLFYVAIGVIAGGRLGYIIFYKLEYYIQNPLEIFALWQGGMSFHGGLIGVIIAMMFFSKKIDKSFWHVTDFLAPLIPIGLFFGRIGNFINQELWGKVSTVPWAVVFYTGGDLPRHPSQLYEAFLEGAVLFIILWFYSQKNTENGKVSGLFLVGYAVGRFIIEFFRQPDAHLGYIAYNWLTMGQILCIPMFLFGSWLMFRKTTIK